MKTKNIFMKISLYRKRMIDGFVASRVILLRAICLIYLKELVSSKSVIKESSVLC